MTVEPTVISEAGEAVDVTLTLLGGGGSGVVRLGISTIPIRPRGLKLELLNEVSRQIKQLNCNLVNSFQLPWVGFEPTTLLSRRALYQLSYQGNSAGRGSNPQHKAKAPQTTVLFHCTLFISMCNKNILKKVRKLCEPLK